MKPGMFFRVQSFALLALYVPGIRVCLPGYYFDVAVDRCESCKVICTYAKIQGTTDECDRFCPDYQYQYAKEATKGQSGSESTTVRTQEKRDKDFLLIPIFIGVCICVCMAVIAAIIINCRDRDTVRQQRATETLRVDLLRHIRVQDGPRTKHPNEDLGTCSSLL